MFTSIRLFIRHSRQLAVISSLLFATLVCGGLIVLRVAYAHNQYYSWLVWNLFLAWIPALSALLIYNLRRKKTRWRWLIIPACGVCWLIFFPNAPYLLTDLIHLRPRPDAPFWFDLIVLVAFAWTGLGLGVVSLVLMQEVIRSVAGNITGWLFALFVLALSSFGIYLGRFLRWNSWDIITNPFVLIGEFLRGARHPFAHLQTIAFSLLFAFVLLAMYLMVMSIAYFRQDIRKS